MKTTRMLLGTDEIRRDSIFSKYERLIDELTFDWKIVKFHVKDFFSMHDFIEYIKCHPDLLETFLNEKYSHIYQKQNRFRDMNVKELIATKIISNPLQELNSHEEIQNILREIRQESFFFPISKLYNPETDSFELTQKFKDELLEFCSNYTENEEQNKTFQALQILADGFNQLHSLKAINLHTGMQKFGILSSIFKIDKKAPEAPVIIDRLVFKRSILKKSTPFTYPERKPESTLYSI